MMLLEAGGAGAAKCDVEAPALRAAPALGACLGGGCGGGRPGRLGLRRKLLLLVLLAIYGCHRIV